MTRISIQPCGEGYQPHINGKAVGTTTRWIWPTRQEAQAIAEEWIVRRRAYQPPQAGE